MSRAPAFPLSAIVGQEDLVEALLVCAVHPVVGGVLVRGERGTAKSTAVRALAPMLGSDAPLVELPLGATLDRLVGALDVRAALGGEHRLEAGLLARADGGLLYVDEVNLLGDHLVDALLDAAAAGEVTVERDGVSAVQDARFLLVGTMNPEEGELRPQLLDRFGLGVQITGPRDVATRVEIVRRRMAYDNDPIAFAAMWADAEAALATRLASSRARVAGVRLGDRELQRIAAVCAQLDLDGIRGDLVCAQAACALAALDGDDAVQDTHVDRAAHLALRHRLRRDPLAPPPDGGDRDPAIDEALAEADDAPPPPAPPPRAERDPAPASASEPPAWSPDPDLGGTPPPPPAPFEPQGLPPHLTTPAPVPSRLPEAALRPIRRPRGGLAVVDGRPAHGDDEIAALPTLLAALRGDPGPRTPVHGGGRGALLCLIVDTSGSMAAHRRLARVKGALEVALRRAYARRDLVAVVAFSGEGARTLVAPGDPLECAAGATRELPVGGRTPLAAGLDHAAALLRAADHGRAAGRTRIAVLLTDGRAADPDGHARRALAGVVAAADRTVVVDLEEGRARLGLASALADAAGADLTRLVIPERAA
ncbi:VWA domain-containing protein [Baekduia soli]|uniref:VWA domain-containing protein n=1 Tax=Baekduia soli TaxID=496014 RepID=A0A5B8U1Y8_9ACTN|nr:VWA domain-containing protein [Baekduia soli]QEC47026.1 VWA domain-containing protein [Baekduia soli]